MGKMWEEILLLFAVDMGEPKIRLRFFPFRVFSDFRGQCTISVESLLF